ncbi:MAG: hypothetical protein ACE5KT_00490 [Methanosarcinales archaeon]
MEVTPIGEKELEFLDQLIKERKSLGLGEAEGISICKHRGCVLVTNDNGAKKVCDQYNINFIDLSMILKSLWKNRIITKDEVITLINEIESKDKMVIKDKDEILQ